MFKRKKRQTAVKGRSSAMLISIIIHALIFFIAGTFVAVEVIQRSETKFQGKQIVRPKMQLKKLQVPVKIEKKIKKQAPKLGQRVTATARVKTKSTDFAMPELSGFGGGSAGVDLSGASLGGSLGFATTQLNVFGLKSTGEKILFILDTNRNMLIDEIGGIPAYKIIKDELLNLIETLPPTALFNVIVFDHTDARAFSRELSPASDANIQKLKAWIGPLNSDKARFGLSTLGSRGISIDFEPLAPIPNIQRGWPAGLTYAVKNGVESVYWLGTDDFLQWIHKDLYAEAKRGRPISDPTGMPPEFRGVDWDAYGGKERWDKLVAEARKKFDEENARRRAAGQPLRVIPGHGGEHALVNIYFPSAPQPVRKDQAVRYNYDAKDVVEYVEAMQKKYSSDRRSATIGLQQKRMSLNVIHFVPKSSTTGNVRFTLPRLQNAATRLHGDYLQIKGMEAIESSATARR
jgi:hypothetical protein